MAKIKDAEQGKIALEIAQDIVKTIMAKMAEHQSWPRSQFLKTIGMSLDLTSITLTEVLGATPPTSTLATLNSVTQFNTDTSEPEVD